MRKKDNLNDDQKRILDLWIRNYKQRGIDLEEDKQEELKAINKEYSMVSEKFQHNVVDDRAQFSYYLEDDSIIPWIPLSTKNRAKKLAWEKPWYLFDADPTAIWDLLKYCSDEKVRKEIYDAQQLWASSWKYDNRENVIKLLSLTKRKSEILWYKNAAEMFLWDTMAQSPEKTNQFISSISKEALKKTEEEVNTLKNAYWLDTLESSDVAYYVRKYKKEHYDLNENKIKEYFEFEHVLSWLHEFVKNFFGVELRAMQTEGEEKRYEVYKDWKQIAYFVLDAFYRNGKRPWAWADILREKSEWILPIVCNVANIQKNENGETLIYFRNMETLFHEFWHALHAMLSASDYAYLNWFNIERDFVELPSQIMENWVNEKESILKLSKHYKTWETIPEDILNTIEELRTFMQGFFVARQNELALVDTYLYTHDVPKNVEELDKEIIDVVNEHSYFKRGEEYKMYCAFLHIFWWGYESKYYSYMWAEAYAADVFSKIKKEWMFNPQVWNEYVNKILREGCRKQAEELFKDFMWREMDIESLMKWYWLH